MARSRSAIALWLVLMLACGWIISRSQFTTDLSAFLPRSPTPAQQLLLEQISDGLASRLILVGIAGSDAPTRARISKQIAQALRVDPAFVSVNNGEPVTQQRDRDFLFHHRYLLSTAVTPERFSVAGLRTAIDDSIALLASPAGLLAKSLLPRDPTGEMLNLLARFDSVSRPAMTDGAWASRDGTRALLLIQTRASGSDTDAQQRAMTAIRYAFERASVNTHTKLLMTGPGVFSVTSRDTIKHQVSQLSLISIALIATLLLLVYRSVSALALGFLPVISGVLVGIAAVSLGFGEVHGITLGFGTALIGEAVDYSIYMFVQSEQGANQQHWATQFWPTVRLGVLTSIFGFASLLLSGFPGLAQLGLYAIAGLVAAAMVTRFVLPHLLPANFRIHDVSAIGLFLSHGVKQAPRLRGAALLLLIGAVAVLAIRHDQVWNHTIASLSPVSPADVALDASLRADMGAPDVRYLVVVAGADQQAVLRSAEQVASVLQTQVDQGELAGFESPSHYLPSIATQRARQASLPDAATLLSRLTEAVQGLPLRATVLAPFVQDVAVAKSQPLIQSADLQHTSMAMAVDGLLIRQATQWRALLPLTAMPNRDIDAAKLRAALQATGLPNVLFVDMKAESDRLYAGYLHEAIVLSLGGVLAIVVLLWIVFRSPYRVLRVTLPLAAAVVTVSAGLVLFGQQLIIMHLVGLLLVVAVGSNYALFFDRPDLSLRGEEGTNAGPKPLAYGFPHPEREGTNAEPKPVAYGFPHPNPLPEGEGTNAEPKPVDGIAPRTLASMLFANLTTVAGFGLLAFSDVAILQAMGATVAPGVMLALMYAAIFAKRGDA